MADEHTGASPAPVAFLTPIITGIMIGVVFLLIFIPALHKPGPHATPVGVVGAAGVTQGLESSGQLSGLKLRTLTDVAQAEKQIKNGDIYAAYVPGASPQLLVSSAHGAVATRTIEGMFTGVAASTGAQLQVKDIVPISKGDPNGVSLFYLIFGVTLGAFLFGQGSFAVARHLPAKVKMLQTVTFSIVLGVFASLVARVWLQVLPGSIPVETGVLILLAAAVGLFVIAVTNVLKDAGVAVGTIVALILGTASSGGAIPVEFIPPGFAFFAHFLAPGAAISALRDIAYFDSGASVTPILVLLAWIGISVAVIFATSGRKGPASAQAPAPARESSVA